MPEEQPSTATRPNSSRSQLFTVRVWLENLGAARSEWRGQVQHLPGGEQCYFRDWQTLVAFILERATAAQAGAAPETGPPHPQG